MPTFPPVRLVRRLATVVATDGELVRHFVDSRCDEAFQELVRRHGPVVYGVCRRTLADHHLAEDAFQAAFVVLARKAHTIRPPDAVGGWLYGVARKAALEAAAVRRRKHRETLPGVLPERTTETPEPDDSAALVDAEIAALPEILRSAVLLCEIQGLSRTQAAERLGIAEGTLSSRLATARKSLAARLRRRGVTLPALLGASVMVPPALAQAAIWSPRRTPSGSILELSDGVLRTMSVSRRTVALIAAGCVLLVMGGFGLPRPATTTAAPVPKHLESPEGVILISSFSEHRPLEMVRPDGTSLRVVKPTGQFQIMNARLSPDRKWAVGVDRGAIKKNLHFFTIRLFDLEPKPAAPKTIAADVFNPSVVWSADGKVIYVSYNDPDKLVDADMSGEPVLFQDWTYSLADGTRTRLKLPPEQQVWDVSPDGNRLLTSTHIADPQGQKLHLVSPNTATPEEGSALASGVVYDAKLSPDGKRLLRSGLFKKGEQPTREWEVVVQDLGTKKQTRLKLPKEMLEHQSTLENQSTRLCWSPDGKRIAFQWEETIPRPAGVPAPPQGPGIGGPIWTVSRVTVCDADGANAKVIVRREYGEPITGLNWR